MFLSSVCLNMHTERNIHVHVQTDRRILVHVQTDRNKNTHVLTDRFTDRQTDRHYILASAFPKKRAMN